MAYAKNAKNAKKEETKEFFDITGMNVQNVRVLSDNVVAFTLAGKGLGLYNMRLVDGKKGEFIASPQQLGKDGKWYNMYAVYLSEEDQAKIISEVKNALE